jgi:hypothetical protein
MRKLTAFVFIFCVFHGVYGQTDANNNPVFNSITTQELAIGKALLISNYYTLDNNITNKKSSVYISENPTLEQIEYAALNLNSAFFMVTKNNMLVTMIMLVKDPQLEKDPQWSFISIVMATQEQNTHPFPTEGTITENRANELIRENYDTAARIVNGQLLFKGKSHTIISNAEIEAAVLALIKKEKLDKKKPSDVFLPLKSTLRKYIVAESKAGGSLDYFTEIKGKEFNGVQVKPGLFANNYSVALYKWGRACFELGLNTIDDAYSIFEEIHQKALSDKDKATIKKGFYKEWES